MRYILSIFIYMGTIFIFFLLLGLMTNFSSDEIKYKNNIKEPVVHQNSSPTPYNHVVTSTPQPPVKKTKKEDNEINKILKKLRKPKETKQEIAVTNVNNKEDYIEFLKSRYPKEIDDIKTDKYGKTIEISGPYFSDSKKIYAFHKKIVNSLKEHSFKEVRYQWYNSHGDYTVFNLN